MADDGFNGSTLTFDSSPVGDKLRSISTSEDGGDVNITGSGHSVGLSIDAIPKLEITATVVGVASQARGDTGAIAVAWNDGTSDDGGGHTFRISKREVSGDMDGELITSLTFVPTAEAA